MSLESRIQQLNHNTKSSIVPSGLQVNDAGFQQTCFEAYSKFLSIDDEKKTGFRDATTLIGVKNEGQPTEAAIRETKTIVWTQHGPLIRTIELGINKQAGGPYEKYHNVSLEGYFFIQANPGRDIPPRYEYANVSKNFYFNASGEVASFVEGFVKIDDNFVPLSDAMQPRDIDPDKAFGLFERQFSSVQSVAQSLPIDTSAMHAAEQLEQ